MTTPRNTHSAAPTIRTAIVTGAGQGFGLALTAALAARGTTMLACARDGDRLRSELGPSPLPRLADLPDVALRGLLETNVLAPPTLTRLALPLLRAAEHGTVITFSSDAAVEAYSGWGGYGASKAALDHLAAVLAVEEPDLAVHAFDPGDLRTPMHQRAFPGEDISDRPEPATVVPALLRLLDERPPSGRWTVAQLAGSPA